MVFTPGPEHRCIGINNRKTIIGRETTIELVRCTRQTGSADKRCTIHKPAPSYPR